MDVNKVYNDYMAQYAQVVENYNKNQQQMKLMKSYLNNSNLKNQHIKREHQQKKVK